MRLAPVPLFYASSPSDAIYLSGESSKTTHGALEAVDACRYYAGLILGALYGESKDKILSSMYTPLRNYWSYYPLCRGVENIATGSFKNKTRDMIKSTGYVIDSLEAAIWAFYSTSTFEEGLIKAVNLGGDSDTIGAIYGQLAGAFYGETSIPYRFIKNLFQPHIFYYIADEMCSFYAGEPITR